MKKKFAMLVAGGAIFGIIQTCNNVLDLVFDPVVFWAALDQLQIV